MGKYKGEKASGVPEQRTSTLTPNNLRFLKDIGGLDLINEERLNPYYEIFVWEREGHGALHFEHEDKREMGKTIENGHLVAALYDLLKRDVGCVDFKDRVEFIVGDEIERISETGNSRRLFLKSGRELEYDLLVGSDGGKSKVKELKNIPSFGWSHNQKAIVRKMLQPGLHCQDRPANLQLVAAIHWRKPTCHLVPLWQLFISCVVSSEQ